MSKKRRDKDFLGDIKEAIDLIASYTKGLPYKKFLNDRKTQDAVVRNFEVIGEASKNISAGLKAKYPEIPWKKISGLRDKLIHFYFGIDYKIVWNIAKKELPMIVKQIKDILDKEASNNL
ncbi:MAG: DUF86 domain-containing protein [Thermodesulfovibrionales bacterium]|nr:DUF86 domain-containing protein [Thermodesulfovibrionales bacterium]